MMKDYIKRTFEEHLGSIKIDKKLINLLHHTRVAFMNYNEDHLEFFSGNLLGVNPVRFRSSDREDWFESILGISESELKDDIKKIPTIDDDWVRANDAMNLSAIWLMYRIHNSSLSTKDKETGLIEICLIMQYKFISSILAHQFPFPADRSVALATYEALSLKFELKQLGSWQALLEHRSKMIIDRKGIHYKTFSEMSNDFSVIKMISDIQDRIREVVKKVRAVFEKVKTQNLRISTTSTVVVLDGEKEIMDKNRDYATYIRYLRNIITNKRTFIRDELIKVVIEAIPTARNEYLVQALSYCSENYGNNDRKIDVLLEESLIHLFSYLSKKTGIMNSPNNLSLLIIELKNLYMASRMTDEQLINMKEISEHIVKKSVRTKNKAAQSSTRTALQVYIVIRALARNYYQGV